MILPVRASRSVLVAGVAALLGFAPLAAQQATPDWLSVSGQMRLRTEHRSGMGFRSGNSDGYSLLRTRINVGVRAGEHVRFFVQGQDARAPGIRTERASGVFRDPIDLRQGYVQVGDAERDRVAATLGRQLLSYGDQRMVGALEWTNTARSFDALKVVFRGARAEVDAFYASVVENDPGRRLNRSDMSNGFFGTWVRIPGLLGGLVAEPFFLWRKKDVAVASEGGGTSTTSRRTLGARLSVIRGGLESSMTVMRQDGSYAYADIDAWAWTASAGYSFDGPGSPTVLVEYNQASGDANPGDETVGWFDDLFPTAHLYYGYADLVGLRNIRNLRLGGGVSPWERLTLALDFHTFRLDTPRDHLYNVAGVATVLAPETGGEEVGVGQEIDLSFSLSLGDSLLPFRGPVGLSGGVGHFFPGPFVEANTEGAASTFLHTAVSWSF